MCILLASIADNALSSILIVNGNFKLYIVGMVICELKLKAKLKIFTF